MKMARKTDMPCTMDERSFSSIPSHSFLYQLSISLLSLISSGNGLRRHAPPNFTPISSLRICQASTL